MERDRSASNVERAWRDKIETVGAITTCICGHSLTEHSEDGCTMEGCACEEVRTEVLEGEAEAIDEV